MYHAAIILRKTIQSGRRRQLSSLPVNAVYFDLYLYGMLNLRVNYPSIPKEMDYLQQYTQQLAAPEKYKLLHISPVAADEEQVLKNWLQVPESTAVVVPTPSSNSGLYCVLQALRKDMMHIAVEPFTFPGFKWSAASFDYQLHSLESDAEGVIPTSLHRMLAKGECKLVYLQPTIQNPTGTVMSLERRKAIIEVVRAFPDVYILEDDAYRFLHPDPPASFLQLLPEQTIHLFSLSKPFNPLLKAAFILHPRGILDGIANFIQLTSSGTSIFFLKAGFYLMENGDLTSIIREKQAIAAGWQQQMARLFDGLSYSTFPNSFHLWLDTGDNRLLTTLREQGMDLPSGADFSVAGDTTYTRIALGTCWNDERLLPGLETIASVLQAATTKVL